ncbi:hypothetical protein SCHPADRAFT_911154 [Schizopora paradoxa]|uniref:Uncharacterized protein n=1 Tax=Schizopora paradoxa TaxID=27342 RepID=A0A0H2R0B6_9AGAM|nr:hypothetical protein SCHPADRAFT_911154 [Schizopora paradoxa]
MEKRMSRNVYHRNPHRGTTASAAFSENRQTISSCGRFPIYVNDVGTSRAPGRHNGGGDVHAPLSRLVRPERKRK